MNSPGDSPPTVLHYYIDEAGDSTLFDKRGRKVLVGTPSSKYFVLGKLEVPQPDRLAEELDELRAKLLDDPYFEGISSMQPAEKKTALAFHAKDDVPEVRREVFQLLAQHELRFYAVVRDKTELLAFVRQRNREDPSYRYRANDLYDTLVRDLFRNLHAVADRVEVVFAKRGNKPRTQAFRRAIELADRDFAMSFGFGRKGETHIESSTPKQQTCLQAVDYFLWGLQRHYERGESRYLKSLWPQVGEIHDLDAMAGSRKGVYFNRKHPPWERRRVHKKSRQI